MEMYGSAIVGGLLSSIPVLVGWIVAVVLAAIILKRGGARAERFLVAGTSLILAAIGLRRKEEPLLIEMA